MHAKIIVNGNKIITSKAIQGIANIFRIMTKFEFGNFEKVWSSKLVKKASS